jgi:hypothetical protein
LPAVLRGAGALRATADLRATAARAGFCFDRLRRDDLAMDHEFD